VRRLAAAVVVAIAVAGCGWSRERSDALASLEELPQAAPTTTEGADHGSEEKSPSQRDCEARHWATASLRPDGTAAQGPSIDELRERGLIRVGVDESTLGFAFRNPDTGEIEGFEVDLARELARRLLGDRAIGDGVQLIPVVTDTKIALVEAGTLDMSISANSMSCGRWEDVAFSSEYYTANQRFLVRKDHPLATVADVARSRVCVTAGSSSVGILERLVPAAELHPVRSRADCLVALQEGEADAYFGHDSFLYGMVSQDPTVEISPVPLLPAETVSHYGVAIAKDRPDLVRAVNAALEEIRSDDTWAALHDSLENDPLRIPDAEPPPASYRD